MDTLRLIETLRGETTNSHFNYTYKSKTNKWVCYFTNIKITLSDSDRDKLDEKVLDYIIDNTIEVDGKKKLIRKDEK